MKTNKAKKRIWSDRPIEREPPPQHQLRDSHEWSARMGGRIRKKRNKCRQGCATRGRNLPPLSDGRKKEVNTAMSPLSCPSDSLERESERQRRDSLGVWVTK
mmetsp:Transcript_39008/g.76714  ORF Transcript_39008/g.76714 Transcript_39008/m.76714 type:complete len:102 (-) Transcript_39008:1981-2286(-)